MVKARDRTSFDVGREREDVVRQALKDTVLSHQDQLRNLVVSDTVAKVLQTTTNQSVRLTARRPDARAGETAVNQIIYFNNHATAPKYHSVSSPCTS